MGGLGHANVSDRNNLDWNCCKVYLFTTEWLNDDNKKFYAENWARFEKYAKTA